LAKQTTFHEIAGFLEGSLVQIYEEHQIWHKYWCFYATIVNQKAQIWILRPGLVVTTWFYGESVTGT